MLALAFRFLLGATVVGLAVYTSDRVDARLGGVLSAVPKTSAVSLFVIAYEHGGVFAAETAVSSMYGLAAVIAYATAFGLLPGVLPERWASTGTVLTLAAAVYALAIAPYLLGLSDRLALAANVALVVLAYLTSLALVDRARGESPRERQPSASVVGVRGHLFRYVLPALVGGSLVLGATLAADLLGPVWGGVAAVFPANVTTVLVTGSIVLGPRAAFEQAAGVPDGVAAAGVFLLALHALLPLVDLVLAGALGYAAWGLSAWLLSTVGRGRPSAEPA